jgi:hypothetical protein
VSLDAYAPAAFAEEIRKLNPKGEVEAALSEIAEGGTPLSNEDKYMAARFVQAICAERPEFISDLSRLASVGLLTEVVEDFLKPVSVGENVDLTIIVDAPIALDLLGCSGLQIQDDVRCIFDSLKSIGCKFIVLPITCGEMQRNLNSMLSRPAASRFGYTHSAIVRRDVLVEYVQAVANNPEQALQKAGIIVRPLNLDSLPSQHQYFRTDQYEDFFASIGWVSEVAPREHDATCLTLAMRLRAGGNRSDIFQCRYVFVTRNARFVRDAREYCLKSRLINEFQESPVIHQRELATVAWLRTGLGASETVPRSHLLATCDRVLHLRREVRETVGEKLKALTPEKIEQYELLLLDQRSIRRLADQTLNDERVITDENVDELLQAMRRATVEEEKLAFEAKISALKSKTGKQIRDERRLSSQAFAKSELATQERDAALRQIDELKARQIQLIENVAANTNSFIGWIDKSATAVVLVIACIMVSNYLFRWLETYRALFAIISGVLGLLAIYHSIMNALERPKVGLRTILNILARRHFTSRITRLGLGHEISLELVRYTNGRVVLTDAFRKVGESEE